VRIERDATAFRIFGVGAGNGYLMPLPVHVSVLDAQHLALAAARFEGADQPIVHA
jgi:hypothetical protein